jgi:hypothetical protein
MIRPSRLVWLAVALAWAVALGACSSVPRVDAAGMIAGYELHGPVDHELARDYLEGRPLPAALSELRQTLLASGTVPTRDTLAWVSATYSPDVATLLFLETSAERPEARNLRKLFQEELAVVRRIGFEQARPTPPEDLLVLMVPGWFYRSNGSETNADFRIQRALYEKWGIAHQLVAIDENGTVEGNAHIVADAIRKASVKHRVFLVSASKSGAEVALALGSVLDARETSRVVGWLSIVGAVRGSPLADRVLEPDMCWFVELQLGVKGFDLEGLKSMRASTSRPLFDGLRFPPHIEIVSLIAVPLSGNISDRGSFGYDRMRELGPNDGLTLLSDELVPGAVPLLLPGTDHFLGPEDQRYWSTALFRVLVNGMDRRSP